jgi:hypothetical protein
MIQPPLTLVGGPIDGLASSRSGGVGASAPAPTPFRLFGWWPPIPAWRSFVTPQGLGIGPQCPECKQRELVRLQSYDPDGIARNRYGCRTCKQVLRLIVVGGSIHMLPVKTRNLSEQLALSLAIQGVPPKGDQ